MVSRFTENPVVHRIEHKTPDLIEQVFYTVLFKKKKLIFLNLLVAIE